MMLKQVGCHVYDVEPERRMCELCLATTLNAIPASASPNSAMELGSGTLFGSSGAAKAKTANAPLVLPVVSKSKGKERGVEPKTPSDCKNAKKPFSVG